ncbi:MAG TPA: O-methyltransferase [Vicinamibacterales bacterium]|nr:O-methyltransferase [Vicinamibacterales bacterium]
MRAPFTAPAVALVIASAACNGAASPAAKPDEAAIQAILSGIRARDAGQLAVSEEDGRFLRVLVATRGTKRALEIGAASGYSGIWIGLGLRETGGRLTTIEYDPARAKAAADNIRRAGLDDVVTVIEGDAFVEVPKLAGSFDFVFLDAWKPDYKKFFDATFPRLDAGGVFLAHNVVNKREEMGDFLDAIMNRPDAWSTIVAPSSEGISLTYKRGPAGAGR